MSRGTASFPKGVTAGQHAFAQIPSVNIPRSSFDRSHGIKTTFDPGLLVPIYVDEALPGDTFACRMSHFARLATLLHPVMENISLDFFFFSVPMRLIYDDWQKMNGEQVNPGDSTAFVLPTMTAPVGGYAIGSLSDYLGIPTGCQGLVHTSVWHRAYNLIWNEWFRDQNLQDSVVVDRDSGPDDPADYVLLRRGKRHDYFTSCLPFPQKGVAVQLPLGDQAPVRGLAVLSNVTFPNNSTGYKDSVSDPIVGGPTNWNLTPQLIAAGQGAGDTPLSIYADLSQATAATINEIREAFQIQRMFERDARGGTRYTEILRSHFGVVSPDQRLQRPEFLGGGTSRMNVNPVAATAQTATPVGYLSAYGTSAGQAGFTKSFDEHCVLIGMVCARADLNYQQGLHRMFSRSTRFDFFWPSLANLGEQAVLNKEIFVGALADPADEEVFGYQERFAEYRYKPSMVTGDMRSASAISLDTWHLAQEFASRPMLNEDFIVENPPIDRIVAVTQEPNFLFDGYFQLRCARPMPVYSVPGMIDHF